MRVSRNSLRAFVPATWTIPENPFFPGMAGLRAFVPATFTLPPQPAGIGRLREFVPANFTLPPQPAGIGKHDDCGCGCGGGCGMSGLGQAATDFGNTFTNLTSGNISGAWSSFLTFMQDPLIGTVPVWVVTGGALLAWAMFFSGGEHSRYQRAKKASSAARRAYA
jgi:hypothetical protein